MRILICSMPLVALAMLASRYTFDMVKADNARSFFDPRALAISQRMQGREICEQKLSQPSIVNVILDE